MNFPVRDASEQHEIVWGIYVVGGKVYVQRREEEARRGREQGLLSTVCTSP